MSEAIGTWEFAEKYGVTQATVSKWCREGKIPNCNQDGKGSPWHIPKDAVPPVGYKRRKKWYWKGAAYSRKAFTLRGLHFQEGEHAQAKLVSCLHGSIFNVAVDIRPGDTFGYAYGEILSFENQKQMLIPRGFAHGYLTLEDDTLMQWCVDNDFCGEAARAIRYDSDFIWQTEPWPVREYILSEKDKNAIKLSELRKFWACAALFISSEPKSQDSANIEPLMHFWKDEYPFKIWMYDKINQHKF